MRGECSAQSPHRLGRRAGAACALACGCRSGRQGAPHRGKRWGPGPVALHRQCGEAGDRQAGVTGGVEWGVGWGLAWSVQDVQAVDGAAGTQRRSGPGPLQPLPPREEGMAGRPCG